MNGQLKICGRCARGYSYFLPKCPHCGDSELLDFECNPFWSEQYQGCAPVLDIPAGTKLSDNRFTVKALLGQGRWSSVFLAHDHLRKLDVALKAVLLGPGSQEEALPAFRHELNLHSGLTDLSHVVHLFDVHVIPWGGVSLLLLAMEHADGGSLRTWLHQNQKDWELRRREGLELFIQACRGYLAIHRAGAVHLDTKPDNLLFVGGVLKVSDLGAAYLFGIDGNQVSLPHSLSCLERGTPIYMSPEQFQVAHPEDLDHRSDIYSLGVILYELLSRGGRPPFAGSLERVRDCHLNVRPARLKGVEPYLEEIVARCLAKDPDERFQSVQKLIEALQDPPQPRPSCEDAPEQGGSGIDEKLQRAASLSAEGDLAQAASLLEEVLAEQPDNSQARKLSRELQERYQLAAQLYTEAATLIENGSMDAGVDRINEAVDVYPNHPSAAPVLSKARMNSERFAECMISARAALKNGAWDSSVALLEEALQLNRQVPNAVEVLKRVNRIRQAITEMHAALSHAEYVRAEQLAGLADALAENLLESIPALREGNDERDSA